MCVKYLCHLTLKGVACVLLCDPCILTFLSRSFTLSLHLNLKYLYFLAFPYHNSSCVTIKQYLIKPVNCNFPPFQEITDQLNDRRRTDGIIGKLHFQ